MEYAIFDMLSSLFDAAKKKHTCAKVLHKYIFSVFGQSAYYWSATQNSNIDAYYLSLTWQRNIPYYDYSEKKQNEY